MLSLRVLRPACIALVACVLGLAGRPAPAAGAALEWLPVDSPAYHELELLRTEGLLDTTVSLDARPMARADVARLTAFALAHHAAQAGDAGLVRLYREFSRELVDLGFPAAPGYTAPLLLWAPGEPGPKAGPGHADDRVRVIPYLDVAGERRADGRGRLADHSRAGLRMGVELGPVLLYQDLFAGRVDGGRSFADPLVQNTDFIHYTEDTYLSARTRWLDISLGRMRQAWGPGATGSQLWSRAADPVTQLAWGGTLFGGRLRGTAVHADVDASTGARLAAHRLDFTLSPALGFGLAEAVRYTSPHWEPLYVLSVVPFTLVQRMLAQDHPGGAADSQRNNVMVSADARWRALPGTTLYGELALDDLTFKKSGSPVRLGYQAGWQGVGHVQGRRLWWQAEWTRVYRYVYAVFYGENFIHHDRPLGYPAGPDSRTVAASGALDLSADWSFSLAAQQLDQGEGYLGEFFDPEGPPARGSRFAGVVERTRSAQAGARWTPRDGVAASLGWGYQWQTGADHVAGAERSGWLGRAELALRY
jgi:hypothetical protein